MEKPAQSIIENLKDILLQVNVLLDASEHKYRDYKVALMLLEIKKTIIEQTTRMKIHFGMKKL